MSDLIKRIDDWLPYADEESGILASLLRDCRAEIERIHTYTPMTDDEWCEVSNAFEYDGNPLSEENEWKRERRIEAHIIKRAGLEVKHD